MPRHARTSQGGFCYHALNRGNGRRTVIHKDGDYAAFVQLLTEAGERTGLRLLAYCLLPNHFHLALWPAADGLGAARQRAAERGGGGAAAPERAARPAVRPRGVGMGGGAAVGGWSRACGRGGGPGSRLRPAGFFPTQEVPE